MAVFPITKPPLVLPKLITWLDAANTSSSSIISSSGLVSAWKDLSGMNQIISQGTSAKQPTTGSATLNGLNVLSFNGANALGFDSVSSPILRDFVNGDGTIFYVAKDTGSTGTPQLFRMSLAGSTKLVIQQNSTSSIGFGWNSSTVDTAFTSTNWNLITCYRQDVTRGISVNGGAFTTATGSSNSNMDSGAIGAGSVAPITPYTGQIAEIILYSRKLTDTEITTINTYIKNKWGLA